MTLAPLSEPWSVCRNQSTRCDQPTSLCNQRPAFSRAGREPALSLSKGISRPAYLSNSNGPTTDCGDSRPEPALSEVEGAVQPGKARQFAETRPSSDRCLFDSKSSNHCHAERRWEDRRSSHRSRSIPTPSAHSILSSPAPVDSCLEQMPFPWPGVAAIALLGGAAVHRCDKFPRSLAASAAEVHLLQYSRTSYVYIAGDARWPPR